MNKEKKIKRIKKIINKWGSTTPTELELDHSLCLKSTDKNKNNISKLIEEFNSDGVEIVIYKDEIEVGYYYHPYEKLPEEIIDEISNIMDNYEKKMETKKTINTCPNCGSPNVQGKFWVNLNNPNIEDMEAVEEEDFWCKDCETNPHFVNVTTVPKDAKVIGYQVVGEDGSIFEGTIHPDMAGSFCVYPLEWAQKRLHAGSWRLLTVWEGDIEEPTIVNI